MTCLLGLLKLRGDRAHLVEYVRTSSVALILWSEWHSSIRGACYSDEPNEACLNQLGRWWKQHPEIKTAQRLTDLFLLLPESAPVRDLPAGSCSRKLFDRVVSRVRALISGEVSHVPYVEWVSGGKPCVVQAAWPQAHSFPSSIREPPNPDLLKYIFKYSISRLVFQKPLSAEFVATCQRLRIPLRDPAAAAQWQQEANRLRQLPQPPHN